MNLVRSSPGRITRSPVIRVIVRFAAVAGVGAAAGRVAVAGVVLAAGVGAGGPAAVAGRPGVWAVSPMDKVRTAAAIHRGLGLVCTV